MEESLVGVALRSHPAKWIAFWAWQYTSCECSVYRYTVYRLLSAYLGLYNKRPYVSHISGMCGEVGVLRGGLQTPSNFTKDSTTFRYWRPSHSVPKYDFQVPESQDQYGGLLRSGPSALIGLMQSVKLRNTFFRGERGIGEPAWKGISV